MSPGVQLASVDLRSALSDLEQIPELDETAPNIFDGYITCPNLSDFGDRCRKKTCVECCIIEARGIARCILQSAPTHALGITRADQGSLKEFNRTVRASDPSFQHMWATEINPRQTLIHTHGYYYSDRPISDEVFDQARRKAGLGHVHQVKINQADVNHRYTAYPFKTLASPDLRQSFLDLNGTEKRRALVHSTTGAWRDGKGGESMSRRKLQVLVNQRLNGRMHALDLRAIADRIRAAA